MVDNDSKRILDNVVKEDDILNENIASTCPVLCGALHALGEADAV